MARGVWRCLLACRPRTDPDDVRTSPYPRVGAAPRHLECTCRQNRALSGDCRWNLPWQWEGVQSCASKLATRGESGRSERASEHLPSGPPASPDWSLSATGRTVRGLTPGNCHRVIAKCHWGNHVIGGSYPEPSNRAPHGSARAARGRMSTAARGNPPMPVFWCPEPSTPGMARRAPCMLSAHRWQPVRTTKAALGGGFRANGPCRSRTYDLGIKSPLLYQLS